MPIADAEHALASVGVAFTKTQESDPEGGAWWTLRGHTGGYLFFVEGDQLYDTVRRVTARREYARQADAIASVRAFVGVCGPPSAARVVTLLRERFGNLVLVWRVGTRMQTLQLSSREAEAWSVAYDDDAFDAPPEGEGVPLQTAHRMLLAARDRVVGMPIHGDAARRSAVETWRERVEWEIGAAGTLVDAAIDVAPDMPVTRVTFDRIVEHARWLSEHERRFPHADDPRDALVRVVGEAGTWEELPWSLGWRMHPATLADGTRVRLVREPFAVGVLRVLASSPSHAGLDVRAAPPPAADSEVDVTRVPAPPERFSRKLRASTITMRHRASGLVLTASGHDAGSVEEILRVLVAPRAVK